MFLLNVSAQAVQGAWPYFTMEKFKWDERMVGISLAVVGVITAIIQGGLIRVIIPRLGQARSVFVGLSLYCLGFLLFAFAPTGWMLFLFLIPYGFGGIAGPAIQGLISTEVPPNAQGELQGGLTSLMTVAAFAGAPIMTGIFGYFTGPAAPVYFPGAAMIAAALCTLLSATLAFRSLRTRV
jgi:DHA1 family tetracycline resistance protein-like MFS transporter